MMEKDIPSSFFLEESLIRQRNTMKDKFSQILRRLPMVTKASSTRSHFGVSTPFKVFSNFRIPLFEGHIDEYDLEKWLNLLEGYDSIKKLSNIEKITFTVLKSLLHVKDWCWERHNKNESTNLEQNPLGKTLLIPSRRNSSMLETIMTST